MVASVEIADLVGRLVRTVFCVETGCVEVDGMAYKAVPVGRLGDRKIFRPVHPVDVDFRQMPVHLEDLDPTLVEALVLR